MKKIRTVAQLNKSRNNLIVWVMCPKCNNLSIATIPDAEETLAYGCMICGDIESSDIITMGKDRAESAHA